MEAFKKAVAFAKNILQNTKAEKIYQEKAAELRISPYNVAVANALNPIRLHSTDFSTYTGKVGEVIRLSLQNIIGIKSVSISIITPDGNTLETGNATQEEGLWKYITKNTNATPRQSTLKIELTDTAGSTFTKEQSL